MLGGGAATLIAISGGNTLLKSVGPLAVLDSGLVIGSIPLFIAAGKNKRKAKNVVAFFRFDETRVLLKQTISSRYIPSFSVKISL